MKNYFSKLLVLLLTFIGIFFSSQVSAIVNSTDMDPSFDSGVPVGFDHDVFAIAQQPWTQKVIMWWQFISYQGTSVGKIVRINSDWSLDTTFDIWDGFTDDTVYFDKYVKSILVQNDWKIVVWWNFWKFDWTQVRNVVRLNSDGSLDSSFNAITGFDDRDQVVDMDMQNDWKIIVCLSYGWYVKFVRLNSDGSLDSSFNIWSGFSWSNLSIKDIAIQNDWKILVWWTFSSYDNISKNNIVRLNVDGSLDIWFDIWSWFDRSVYSIATKSNYSLKSWPMRKS